RTRTTPAQIQQTLRSNYPASSRRQGHPCRGGICIGRDTFVPAGSRNPGGSTSGVTGSADQPHRVEPTPMGRAYHQCGWQLSGWVEINSRRRCGCSEAHWANRSRCDVCCRCAACLARRYTAFYQLAASVRQNGCPAGSISTTQVSPGCSTGWCAPRSTQCRAAAEISSTAKSKWNCLLPLSFGQVGAT